MTSTSKTRVVEIEIKELSKKGNGLGLVKRQDGTSYQVEVPFTMPGDKVRAALIRKRGGVYGSRLEEIITPSPDRIMPRCVHFGTCGGCRFQHLSYEQQLKHKESLVEQCFAKLLPPNVTIDPIVAAEQPWHYRNKMEYTFSSDAAGKKYLGLVMDSSRGKVFNISECFLTDSWFVSAVKTVREWWQESNLDAYHLLRDTGSLRTLTLREGQRTGDRMVILTVSGNPDFALHKGHLESFVAFLRDTVEPSNPSSHLSIFLRIQQIARGMTTNTYEMLLYGPDHIREVLQIKLQPNEPPLSLVFHISPSTFFQPNTRQAEQLYSTAINMAQIPQNAVVYDLYCGTGALGLCSSKFAKEVIGIDVSPESALDARTNAQRNGCKNVTIITGAVRYVLSHLPERKIPAPDVVMVDPPRPGLDPEAIRELLTLKPPKILYVSCNPITQALNVAELLQHGYRIAAIRPVDQFPQTYHIENIVVLVKE